MITRLFPGPSEEVPLEGTYLTEGLHRLGSEAAPFVYASFIQSLDGRIALDDELPRDLANGNDLRLLLELIAQADCLITHGGYLRALAEGRLGDVLTVRKELSAWRVENGLAAQPDVCVASASLDFPMPALAGRRVTVATVEGASIERVEAFRSRGIKVIPCGRELVEGGPLVRALGGLGYRSLYLLAGPMMLETMLRHGALSRLYLTMAHRLLGGEGFSTMLSGPPLGPAGRLQLRSLYHDDASPDGTGQWFASFAPTS